MAVQPDGRRSEIRALTGLRAVVATWVVLFHFVPLLMPYLTQVPMALPVVNAGWTGVELFFVLSGFVITRSCLDRVDAGGFVAGAVRFLVARVARVWPAWAVVTVCMCAWLWGIRRAGLASDLTAPHPDAGLVELLRQLSMTQMWGDRGLLGASYLLPGWSVSAEWAAYVAFPVLALALRPLRRLPAVVLLCAGVVVMTPLAWIAFTTGPINHDQHWELRIACGFTAGALCALGVRKLRPGVGLERAASTVLWTCVGLVPAAALWAGWRVAGGPGQDYTGVVVVLFPLVVVALALTERGPARLLSSPALVYGGRISYSLYLVHFAVFDITMTIAWQDQAMIGVLTPGLALAAPLLVLACFGLAAGLHHGVEEPARVVLLRLAGGRPRGVSTPLPSGAGAMARRARPVAADPDPAPAPALVRPAVRPVGPAVPQTAVLAALPPVARTRMRIATGTAAGEVRKNVVARV